MKNKKKLIITIIILILGILLISNGIISYLSNKNKNIPVKKEENIINKEDNKQDDYDPNSFNEYRDLEGLDKKLVITDFKYDNKYGKCEFEFTITNNYEEDIYNKLLKVNFYDENKNLLNTFEYNIDYLGVHSRIGIKYFVEVSKKASIFNYEFNKKKIDIK